MINAAPIHRLLAVAVTFSLLTACAGSVTSSPSTPAEPVAAQQSAGSGTQSSFLSQLSSLSANASDNSPDAGVSHFNQTEGYGADHLLTFTYQQSFDCVDQPFEDRNYNGIVASQDPAEFFIPLCQIGAPNTLSPSGKPVSKTDQLIVLVPFFETNPSQPAFTPKLGMQLKKFFGFVPDAFKPHPGLAVQCPEPGPPATPFKGKPGTCTMHPLQQDIGPVLSSLGLIPPKTIFNTPLVNHSHLLNNDDINNNEEWWQVVVVLVKTKDVWPNRAGTQGITSVAKLQAAQQKGLASPKVFSNFFLFFSSKVMSGM